MCKVQSGFSIVIVMALIMLANIMMLQNSQHLMFLYKIWQQWQAPELQFADNLATWRLIQTEPCLLLCQKTCRSSEIWQGKYEKWLVYKIKPLKRNLCQQKKPLKIYHAIVAWRLINKT